MFIKMYFTVLEWHLRTLNTLKDLIVMIYNVLIISFNVLNKRKKGYIIRSTTFTAWGKPLQASDASDCAQAEQPGSFPVCWA